MEFSAEVLDSLAEALARAGYLSTREKIEETVREVAAQLQAGKGRFDDGVAKFSPSKAIRGLIWKSQPGANSLSRNSTLRYDREGDIAYAERTLLTGTTPGSYLVPTIQADSIVGLLASRNQIRASGCRIWPMNGIQRLNVPTENAALALSWGNSSGQGTGGQGQTLTPQDPNFGQLAFDLKSAKSLTAIPNELLATSVPAIDQIVSELLALSFAQGEMNANVATATGTGMPTPLYAASGTTVVNANGGNANGGAVKWADILGAVGQFYAAKGRGNPAWFMHPTVFYKDVMGILDSSGRPIVTGFESLENPFQGRILGYPVYVSAEFPINQAVGSGTNQSYIVFTNPQYLHIADEGSLELAVSFERFFDSNETAIRGVHRVDFGYAPAAAIIVIAGVNV